LALKPDRGESFLREVDEELRRDQLTGFGKRYGKWIVIGALLFLAALGAFLWWQHQQRVKSEQHAEQLNAAFEDIQAGRMQGVDAALDQLAKEGAPGYRAAALLTRADMAVQARNDAAAAAGFKAVADDKALPEPYRELALIRQTAIEFDRIAPQAVIDRLRPLAVAGNPWLGSAGEMVAVAYLKQGKRADAARIFAAMAKDDKLPETIRSRATQMAGSLGVDAVQDPAPAGAGAGKEVNR
jgi:hypothetical protein